MNTGRDLASNGICPNSILTCISNALDPVFQSIKRIKSSIIIVIAETRTLNVLFYF